MKGEKIVERVPLIRSYEVERIAKERFANKLFHTHGSSVLALDYRRRLDRSVTQKGPKEKGDKSSWTD